MANSFKFGSDNTPTPTASNGGSTGTQIGEFDWIPFLNAPSAQIMTGFNNTGTNFYNVNDEYIAEFPGQFTVYDQFVTFGWLGTNATPTVTTNNPPGYPTLVIANAWSLHPDLTGNAPSPWKVLFYPDPVNGSYEVIMYTVVFHSTTFTWSWPGGWIPSVGNPNRGVSYLTFNSNIPYGGSLWSTSTGTLVENVTLPTGNATGLLPSFALIGTYSAEGDTNLAPSAVAGLVTDTVSGYVVPSTPVYVVWTCTNIVQVTITGNNGVDPVVNSGFINTVGQNSGSFEINAGFTHDITLTFTAYDTVSHVAVTQELPVVYASGAMEGLSIIPSNPSVLIHNAEQFTAVATFADSSTAPLLPTAPAWASSHTGYATINASGLAEALTIGTTSISAMFQTFNASTNMTVYAPTPALVQLALNGELELPSGTVTATITEGNWVVGFVCWRPVNQRSANWYDTLSNSWVTQSVPAPPESGSPPAQNDWYNYGLGYALATTGGSDTIHDSLSGGPFSFLYNVSNIVMEFSNLDTFEGSAFASDPEGTSPVSVTYNTPDSGPTFTFTTTESYTSWYANLSSYIAADNPNVRVLVLSLGCNDVSVSSTVAGWTQQTTGPNAVAYGGIWVQIT